MKNLILVTVFLLSCTGAWAQEAGQFGLGVNVGDPMGLTGKYWFDRTRAADAGLNFVGHMAAYADILWNTWDLFPKPPKGRLGGYVGLGPRLKLTDDNEFGIRTMAGADYWIEGYPIETYLEAGPVFELAPSTTVDFNGSLGVRFYFGGSQKK